MRASQFGFVVSTLMATTLSFPQAAGAWEGREHRIISDAAFSLAFKEANAQAQRHLGRQLPPLPWRDRGERWISCTREIEKNGAGCSPLGQDNHSQIWIGNAWGTFGEAAMVAGDHVADEKAMQRLTANEWAGARNAANRDGMTGDTTSGKARYLGLALTNTDHFGSAAVLAYAKSQESALKMALQSVKENRPALMANALRLEAFAAHFLEDLFAAGHVMVEDGEGNVALYKNGSKSYSDWVMGTLGGLFYDKHGAKRHDFWNREGLWVKALRCQFAASCSHLKADFCRVMQPPHLQADAATSTRG